MPLQNERIVDPVLTNLVQGMKRPTDIWPIIAPEVLMDKEGGKIPIFSNQEFKEYNTERAIRASSNIIQPEKDSTIDVVLTEHDAALPMDYREIAESTLNIEKRRSYQAQSIILNKIERAVASLIQNTANYDDDHKLGLTDTDQWNDKDNAHPVDQIDEAKEAIRKSIGISPNVLILTPLTFNALRRHPQIVEQVKYSERAIITPDILAKLLEFEKVVVGQAVTMSDAGELSDVWGNTAIVAYVAPAPPEGIERDEGEPSFAYTFRKRGYPQIDKFMAEGNKVQYVRCTDIVLPKIVGANAGFLFTNCVALKEN